MPNYWSNGPPQEQEAFIAEDRHQREVPVKHDIRVSRPKSLPTIASAECSPSIDAFPYPDAYEAYLDGSYPKDPDYAIDEYINTELFGRTLDTIELLPQKLRSQNSSISSISTSQRPPANMEQHWAPAHPPDFELQFPFNNALAPGLPFGMMNNMAPFEPSVCSPPIPSRTPSFCEDNSRSSETGTSPAPTTISLKRETPPVEGNDPLPKRKRGRPRINRTENDGTGFWNADSPKSRPSRRLPHNQVERKYREGLNSELERLRRAVPTLPQCDSSDLCAPPKPSKATILSSAIEYIANVEAERDSLLEENERLRGGGASVSDASPQMNMREFMGGWPEPNQDKTAVLE